MGAELDTDPTLRRPGEASHRGVQTEAWGRSSSWPGEAGAGQGVLVSTELEQHMQRPRGSRGQCRAFRNLEWATSCMSEFRRTKVRADAWVAPSYICSLGLEGSP